jgi:acyl-CoA synthetase (AMP-forming)/AMP-acid ligase II
MTLPHPTVHAAFAATAARFPGQPFLHILPSVADACGIDAGEITYRDAAAPDADTECGLLYTSGTTGRPKGCVLPTSTTCTRAQWYDTIGGLCTLRPGEERLLTPLPMVHMNAMAYSTMAMVLTGGCIVPLDRFPPEAGGSVRESGATIVHYLGVMPAMLMKAPARPTDRAHACASASAPASTGAAGAVRGALRFPAAGGLGDDRDRRRRGGDRHRRTARTWAAAASAATGPDGRSADRRRRRQRARRRRSPASCGCAPPGDPRYGFFRGT